MYLYVPLCTTLTQKAESNHRGMIHENPTKSRVFVQQKTEDSMVWDTTEAQQNRHYM